MSAARIPSWRSWSGLVAAPAAWIVHHQTGSDLNFSNCHRGDATTLVLIGATALTIAVVGGALSFNAWRKAGGSPEGTQENSSQFIAVLAMMASALLSLTIVVQISASLILPPCFR